MVRFRQQCTLRGVRLQPQLWLENSGKRTERHLYALSAVEDDCRVILGTVTSERGVNKVTLTLYGILDNGTKDDG